MSRRRCDCNGPVVVSAFGAGVQRCEDLGVTLPPPLPQSDAAHDACFWPYGARNQKEYDAKVASNELLQMGPYERAALRECMPRIRGLDDYQFKLRLKSYVGTEAYRYAAARMPDWFGQMCQTGALVPYIAGEEVARAAAAPSPPTRRAPAAAAPRRPSPRAATPRRRPPPPVQPAVARAEPDEPDGDERIDVENLTRDDWNPGASMQEKDVTLKAFLVACGKGVFGEARKDCDVPQDWVSPKGYPFGRLVWNRRGTFGRSGYEDADRSLLDVGFVPVSLRCNAAKLDEAIERNAPLLRRAAKRGLGPGQHGKLSTAVNWLRKRLAGMKSRPSDAADDAVLNLAKELGKLAPKDAVHPERNKRYWAHDLADKANAVLKGEDDEDDEDDEEAAPAVAAAPSALARRAPAAAPVPRQSPLGATAPPPPPRREKEIDATKLTEADWDPNAPMAEKDDILVACCRAIGQGKIPGLADCDVPKDCVFPNGYRFGDHVSRRRGTFGSDGSDPDADQALLDAGFVPISLRCNAASADAAWRRNAPMLRAAARRGLGATSSVKLDRAVSWLRKRVKKALATGDADDVFLNLAKELGDAAPAGAKSGQNKLYWAHDLRDQASALAGANEEDDDEEDAPLPATRPRRKVVYASDADEDEGEAFVAVGGDGHDSEEDDGYDAPMVPKKRKRAAAARAKPVKKRPGRRR